MVKDLSKEFGKLDQEWIDLILEALDMGMSVQEIETFLHNQNQVTNF
ncbi:anti-repressor SinI family protein [Bacillus sp. DJP31]